MATRTTKKVIALEAAAEAEVAEAVVEEVDTEEEVATRAKNAPRANLMTSPDLPEMDIADPTLQDVEITEATRERIRENTMMEPNPEPKPLDTVRTEDTCRKVPREKVARVKAETRTEMAKTAEEIVVAEVARATATPEKLPNELSSFSDFFKEFPKHAFTPVNICQITSTFLLSLGYENSHKLVDIALTLGVEEKSNLNIFI